VNYKRCAIAFWAGLSFAVSALAGPAETPWDTLRHLPKHRVYTVLNRDGACATGTFVAVSDSEITLDTAPHGEHIIPRSDVLRISLGETADLHAAVYSARSSWSDLESLETPPYYSELMVVTSDNRQFKGSLLGISNDELTLTVDHLEMRFAKEYVDRVLLASIEQPGAHRSLRKLPKLNAPMQPVPLYEITARQDNSRVDCLPASTRK
jgi:hypothetical protein